MDIFEFAMKMEADGKVYYEKHAASTDIPELKEILLQLAEEEARHYETFRRMKEDPSDISGAKLLTGAETLKSVQNIFEQLSTATDRKPFGEDVISVWKTAHQTEVKSEQFYRDKAGLETDAARKKVLLRIAEEENVHMQMIDGIITYLKHPQTFIDSAHYKNFRSLEGFGMDE
jgi:rubrerythrin